MNFQDWFELYLSTYKRDIKPRTREEYVRQYHVYIAPIIGAQPLEAITPEDCQAIINAAAAKGERISQAVFALLRATFRRAVRSRRLCWSPMDAVDRPKHRPEAGSALDRIRLSGRRPGNCRRSGFVSGSFRRSAPRRNNRAEVGRR